MLVFEELNIVCTYLITLGLVNSLDVQPAELGFVIDFEPVTAGGDEGPGELGAVAWCRFDGGGSGVDVVYGDTGREGTDSDGRLEDGSHLESGNEVDVGSRHDEECCEVDTGWFGF